MLDALTRLLPLSIGLNDQNYREYAIIRASRTLQNCPANFARILTEIFLRGTSVAAVSRFQVFRASRLSTTVAAHHSESSCALATDHLSLTTVFIPLVLRHEGVYLPVEGIGERRNMTASHLELPQGTLDLLILRTLALEPQHGWAISERIHQISSKVLQVQQGSLYPALHRLERRGWIKSRWGVSENNRRAKYYELTARGRKQLEAETTAWEKLTSAIAQVLDMA
jgi:PadR family transcriptional regulator, regulatory protein PadR